MNRPAMFRFLLSLAVLFVIPLTTHAGDHLPGVVIADRHAITAEFTSGDADSYAILLCEGDFLTVNASAGKGSVDLSPGIRLRRPDGKQISIVDWLKKLGSKKPVLKNFPVPEDQSGIWTLEVVGNSGTGPYTVGVKVKRAKPVKLKALTVPAGGVIYLPVAADVGGLLTVSVKEKQGGPLTSIALLDPAGQEVPPEEALFVRKKKRITAKSVLLLKACERYSIELTGHPDQDTIVDVKLSLKYPRPTKRKATLPPEPEISAIEPEVLLQGAVGRMVTIRGTNFLPDTEASIDGAGAVIAATELQIPGKFALTIDVDEAASYGARNITLYPPPSLGEPIFLRSGVRVNAPDPSITAATGGPLRQDETAVTVEIEGNGFRAGGEFYLSVESLVVKSLSILDSTRAVMVLDVPVDAPVGPVHLTYSQPAAGGGASVASYGLFDLKYPIPELIAVTPDGVRGGRESSVTVTGRNFRAGGTLTMGSGVAMENVEQVSATEYRFDIAIPESASPGDRDVVYTHPADGGGEVARLTDGFRVLQLVERTLFADDTAAGDAFGTSVDADGKTIVVGAPRNTGDVDWSGAAYVFTYTDGKWVQSQKLLADDATKSAHFGMAVRIQGDTIAVGATRQVTGGERKGTVYVFTRKAGKWSQTAKLKEDQDVEGDPEYGETLALDGDTLLVGAPDDLPTYSSSSRGSAYLYRRSGSDWVLQKKVWNPKPDGAEYCGTGCALEGDTAVLGSPWRLGATTRHEVGGAVVFTRSGTTWSWQTNFSAPGASSDDTYYGRFGWSVGLDNGILAVGDDRDKDYSGAVYIYTGQTNTWTLQQKLVPKVRSTSGHFGYDLDLKGDVLLVGGYFHDEGVADGGAIFVFTRKSGQWTQSDLLYPKGVSSWDQFGNKVAIGDGFYVASSPRDDDKGTDSGSITIFHEE